MAPADQCAPVVRLVKNQSDEDIVEQLRILIEEAARGEVVGLILAAHYGGDEFSFAGSGSFCGQLHMAATALHQLGERFFPTI